MLVIYTTAENSPQLLNVPEPPSFDDRSALNVKSNLQSQQYQDFIHTLYRYDKDNLKRVDSLFEAAADNLSANLAEGPQQPSYSDYIQSQPNNFFGISQEIIRNKRSAQGAIFRPLFVYRIFQERLLEREEERLRRRRLHANRRQPIPIYLTRTNSNIKQTSL